MRSLHVSIIQIFEDSPIVVTAVINDEFTHHDQDPLYGIRMKFDNDEWPAYPTRDLNEIMTLIAGVYDKLMDERERPHKTGLSIAGGNVVRIKERGVGSDLIPW